MIRILLISVLSSVLLIGLIENASVNLFQNTYGQKTGHCNPATSKSLWDHTYGAGLLVHGQTSRLKELSPQCVVFDGVVRGTPEIDKDSKGGSDGDLHIDLTPDGTKPNDNWDLLNGYNTKGLVTEVICWGHPTKSYTDEWGQFCNNINPQQHLPSLNQLQQGAHLRITGKWVQDIGYPPYPAPGAHIPWNEIHPVESIEILK